MEVSKLPLVSLDLDVFISPGIQYIESQSRDKW